MKIQGNHIFADEGKVLRRISDKQESGSEVCLGYTYYLDGKKLDVPLLELPEHYEEVADIVALKHAKIEAVLAYDSSANVNVFRLGGHRIWLDKTTRVGLVNSVNAEKSSGRGTTTLWYEGVSYCLPVDYALEFLRVLELYALECYNVTQRHIASVNSLTDREDVDRYDFRQGYPQVLVFNV